MKKIFYASITILVIAAIGVGLYLAGSPQQQRVKKFDQRRVSDMQQITFEIESYYRNNEELPQSLEDLELNNRTLILLDPKTSEKYRYKVLNDQEYQLCANFELSSDDESRYPVRPEYDWSHPKGEYCFKRSVENVKLDNNSTLTPKPRPVIE